MYDILIYAGVFIVGAACGFAGAYFVARNNAKYIEAALAGKLDVIVAALLKKIADSKAVI